MGTPAPLVVPGVHVPSCWDPGKPFSNAVTPRYITVEIVGTVKGPLWSAGDGEPMNGRWTLTQDTPFFARWRLSRTSTPDVRLVYGAGASSLSALNAEGSTTFRHFSAGNCALDYVSDDLGIFLGGTATVTIPS